MPVRDPTKTQLDNPQLVADLINELQIIGTIGLLDFIPAVNPVFIVGSRGLAINVELPVFQSAELFDGSGANQVAGTILADTGQLAAGDYDIWANLGVAGVSTPGNTGQVVLQHRNAANAATLATIVQVGLFTSAGVVFGSLPLTGYQIAQDERIRASVVGATISGIAHCSMGVRRRPTP